MHTCTVLYSRMHLHLCPVKFKYTVYIHNPSSSSKLIAVDWNLPEVARLPQAAP